MAERTWTVQQRQCIDARGGTVLVSAAAGSGKTSVLVQRVITRITDPQEPVDVDRLLVVTFTKAAAAEMKQRLASALTQLQAEHPDDRRLQRQQMLLPRANISTVHSFCANLLREYFHLLDLSPQFKVAEAAETALLREEALSEIAEECYREKDPVFLELSALLGCGRDDRGLFRTVQKLYDFVQSHPFPERWLTEKAALYTADAAPSQTVWGAAVLRTISQTLAYALSLLDTAIALAGENEKMAEAYGPALTDYRQQIEEATAQIGTPEQPGPLSWDEIGARLRSLSCGRFSTLRNCEDETAKTRVTALRDEVKKRIGKLPALLCGTEEQCCADVAALQPLVAALFAVVRRYSTRYAEKKKKRRILDFNDLEHYALALLVQENPDGTTARTPLAHELAARYDEVLVDEYQDTNAAQDALFSALSREQRNLFMVGDVKQSIYGFRQAMPSIFIGKRDAYPDFDGEHFPATITLGNNFRSRPEVTDAVNFVFRQLMTRETGGVTYDEREALVPSASYPPSPGSETELLVVDKRQPEEDKGEDTPDADRAEARVIARRIRELMADYRVTDKEGPRPVRYGDICILMRSKSTHAQTYIDGLNACGIPAWTSSGGGFFAAPEVAAAVSLLRIIDNPAQDVPLLTVLLSAAFGFTPDDLARIRMNDRHSPLLPALRRMARSVAPEDAALSARCAAFDRRLRHYRTLAAAMPADELIHRVLEDSGLLAAAAARRHGAQRVANLRLLHDYARRFEQGGFRGLSAFVRFLDRLEQQNEELPPASAIAEHADVVRLMTIHNSKGLEFPIVFLARLGGLFNRDSTKGDVLLHPEMGIGLMRREEDTLKQYDTLPRRGVALTIERSERAEELRVLYVAMTRAREKLCMVLSLSKPESALTRLAAALGNGDTLPAHMVLSAASMSDWLLAAALRHPSGGILRTLAGDAGVSVRPADAAWNIQVMTAPPADGESADSPTEAVPDAALLDRLRERFAYVYPYAALQSVPAKLAASALAGGTLKREFVAAARPAFVSEGGLTPAERGTALHTFMQFADYARAASDAGEEAARLVSAGFLTEQQGRILPLPKIRAFFRSPLYARMQASARCLREVHFTIDQPATLILGEHAALPPDAADEALIVQGIADCVFEENGGLVIVDYKTDRVSDAAALAEHYAGQLRIYACALERTLGLPVTECLLYSFSLGQTVPVAWKETGE